MADFLEAYVETMGNEGEYAWNPDDAGGETYKGISRKFHPTAPVWAFIDNIKSGLQAMPDYGGPKYYPWVKRFNQLAQANPMLRKAVRDFFEINFWHANNLNMVKNQHVANQMYDWAVNTGSRGNVWIQKAVGTDTDGDIGPKSLAAINAADPHDLLDKARQYALNHRLAVCARHPSQRQFLASWLRRDGFEPDEIREIIG